MQAHGHQRLGPDINESMRTFSSNAGDVRFGLAAVKGVGAAAVESIIAERKANGLSRTYTTSSSA